MFAARALVLSALVFSVTAQQAQGSLTANGKTARITHAIAIEVDSDTEAGYMDVLVVLSDRELDEATARDLEKLERMAQKDGLVALVFKIDPDARLKSAEPLHAAFKTIISSGAFASWEPSAYDDNIAGRIWTDGTQDFMGQKWSYDLTFSAPIILDPDAIGANAR